MIVKIKESDCERIEDLSYYNHNYYELPFTINGCTMLHIIECDCYGVQDISLGCIQDNEYIIKFYVNEEPVNETFIFNSESISIENKFT